MNNIFFIKRAYVYALAIFSAFIISHYFARSEKYWLILTSILVMQTAIGVALRQSIQRYLFILFSVIIGTLFSAVIPHIIVTHVLAVIFFSLGCYFSMRHSENIFYYKISFICGLLISLTMILPSTGSFVLYSRLYDVTLGAIIGIIVNLVIFSIKINIEFPKNIIPILNSYETYLSSIFDLLLKKDNLINKNRLCVEKNLQVHGSFFPDWVYEAGLSQAFRPGYRHFLIMVERIGQTLFSMHLIAKHSFREGLLEEMKPTLLNYANQTTKVLNTLITVLNLKKPTEPVSDLSEEIQAVEDSFKKAVPLSLELLDISEDYILLAAFIENLKDLRVALVRLGRSIE